MQLADYQPLSNLVVKHTLVKRSRFPVIDAHNHLDDEYGYGLINRPLGSILSIMDDVNVKLLVDLDGAWGEKTLQTHLNKIKQKAPDRFKVFGGIPWKSWLSVGVKFPDYAAKSLREQALWGAEGLAVGNNFGLHIRDHKGNLVAVDDHRLDIIWATAAELKLPVIINTAAPVAFFEPLDQHNERSDDLIEHPEWHNPSPPFPAFLTLIKGLAALVSRQPKTTFIGGRIGSYPENLAWVAKVLDHCPNFYVDISDAIMELGRQPYSARNFFLKYADRILFGLGMGVDKAGYQTAFRFLETDDEYFGANSNGAISQSRWQMYGINLPDDVLLKVYSGNAERVLG